MKRIGKILLVVFIIIVATGLYLFAADALYVDNSGIHFEMDNITAAVFVRGTVKEERNILEHLVPVGTILPYAGDPEDVPVGWFFCDGSLIAVSAQPRLHDVIGTKYGGDGDTFRLPDLRGRFLRGDASTFSGAADGTPEKIIYDKYMQRRDENGYQPDAVLNHIHGKSIYTNQDPLDWGREVYRLNTSVTETTTFTYTYGGPTSTIIYGDPEAPVADEQTSKKETRPMNAGVNYIIKY